MTNNIPFWTLNLKKYYMHAILFLIAVGTMSGGLVLTEQDKKQYMTIGWILVALSLLPVLFYIFPIFVETLRFSIGMELGHMLSGGFFSLIQEKF